MRHLGYLARLLGCTATALALASACGGKSFVAGDDDDDTAGSSSGGSNGTAGKTSVAGKSAGGSVGTGGGIGTGGTIIGTGGSTIGTGGTGQPWNEACDATPDSGMCDAYVPSWYHDANTGICRPFVYGGCGGNQNRYPTLEDCQKVCPGGAPNYDVCNAPSDCIVTGTGCCGVCDSPNVSKHDLIAYNRQYGGALDCGFTPAAAPAPGADIPACAPCPPVAGGSLKYFVPSCERSECTVTDLRESPLTTCKTADECTLRYGTGCCQSCNPDDVIGIRKNAALEQIVCPSNVGIACDACVPPDNGAVAICNAGRCGVAYTAGSNP